MKSINFRYDIYIYMIIGYAFSIAIRYFWVYNFSGVDSFFWDSQLMINTNDGYFWVSGAKDLADGIFTNNPRVPGAEYGLVYFTYIMSKVLPFSLDTIVLYMPAVISSMIVIPIVLLANLYNRAILGLFAALIASITWSFYNRTMIGYYDSDLFALVFPMFIIYLFIRAIKLERIGSLFLATLLILLYFYAYDASKPVIYGMGIGFILYNLVFLRTQKNVYGYITLVSISMLNIDWKISLFLLIVAFIILQKGIIKNKIYEFLLALFVVLMFLYLGNVFNVIWNKVFAYMETGIDKNSSLKFFQVHQTIQEAGKIPFETFANRISGSIPTFIIATLGYTILVFRKKEFLLFLPLVGIGFFAYIGGLRFTVYAVPALAIGGVYFFYFISTMILSDKKYHYLVAAMATIGFLYPNINHVISYKVPTVFQKQEVEVLDRLKKISSPKDYTLAWWDYGYPIWYYSNTNTLIDGGKHNHDNFLISKILTTTSQTQAVNLSRLAIETYVDSNYSVVADNIFKNGKKDQINPAKLLEELSSINYTPPQKTRDIYLYLPSRMLNILPTVNLFSNIDLVTGIKKANSFFYSTKDIKEDAKSIILGRRGEIVFDKTDATLIVQGQKIPVNSLYITQYDKKRVLKTSAKQLHKNGGLYVIFMKDYKQFIIVDKKFFNSLYVQLFVFENYDKKLFEPVILDPLVKVYKLKR